MRKQRGGKHERKLSIKGKRMLGGNERAGRKEGRMEKIKKKARWEEV